MMKRALLFGLSLAFAAACGDDKPDQPKDAGVDATETPDAACFENPQTHAEIINACTTAQKVYKQGHPALQLPDGGLPAAP